MQKTQDFFVALHIYGALRGAQNDQKLEFSSDEEDEEAAALPKL